MHSFGGKETWNDHDIVIINLKISVNSSSLFCLFIIENIVLFRFTLTPMTRYWVIKRMFLQWRPRNLSCTVLGNRLKILLRHAGVGWEIEHVLCSFDGLVMDPWAYLTWRCLWNFFLGVDTIRVICLLGKFIQWWRPCSACHCVAISSSNYSSTSVVYSRIDWVNTNCTNLRPPRGWCLWMVAIDAWMGEVSCCISQQDIHLIL